MRCSQKGRNLIQSLEGCRHVVYLDFADKPTVGYGHFDPKLLLGQLYSQEQIEHLFENDLIPIEQAVDRLTAPVILTQGQFDALVSLVFNIGITAFTSSSLRKVIQQGRFEEVPTKIKAWNKIHDPKTHELVPSSILTDRRDSEVRLWNSA